MEGVLFFFIKEAHVSLYVPGHLVAQFVGCATVQASETVLRRRRSASRATQMQLPMMPIRSMSPVGPPPNNSKVRTKATSETATSRPVANEYQAQPRLAGLAASRRASTKQATLSEMNWS